MCEDCDEIQKERRRLTELALQNPTPCVVCDSRDICGAGTWLPDDKTRLIVKQKDNEHPVFAFCLCHDHADFTEPNTARLIEQSIIRKYRSGFYFRA